MLLRRTPLRSEGLSVNDLQAPVQLNRTSRREMRMTNRNWAPTMKILPLWLFLSVLVFATEGLPQSRGNKAAPRAVYYIEVARCNAGQLSKKQWQQTADKLKRAGIPAFFAITESLPLSSQTRGEWLLVRITRRYSSAHVDALVLGPFSSKKAASAAVNKIPNVVSGEGSALEEEHSGMWGMGCFIIMGTRAS
jgi:hypothetical protein